MVVYSKNYSDNNAAIGKIETPIKMIIEHQSDLYKKKGGICDWLFNVEKSKRFGETLITESEFNIFQAAEEGTGAERDVIGESSRKFIEHIQFMKEFIITAEMMEDAHYGLAPDAKRRAEAFTRAYYKTVNSICEQALINGTNTSMNYARATVDLTTPDGKPLFSKNHPISKNADTTQSNFFWGDIFSKTVDGKRVASPEVFEEALAKLSIRIRNMKDEAGTPLGYTADTLILPGNRPVAEIIAKKVCGTPGALGNGYNDINLHFGGWNIVILPGWFSSDDKVIVMSSEANRNLCGNMFFNRVPLTVTNWIDHHSGNYIWNGRCRFGVGFGTFKHILLAVDSGTSLSAASALTW